MTLASVMKRAPKPVIAPVLSAYQSAADKQTRLTLLDVMGQVSANEALPILRAALKDPDPDVARASILALSSWQNADPFPDLLEVARSDANPTRQILALRGCIKVIAAPSDRPPADSVALLKQVWAAGETAGREAGDPGHSSSLSHAGELAYGRCGRGRSGCQQGGQGRRGQYSRVRSSIR